MNWPDAENEYSNREIRERREKKTVNTRSYEGNSRSVLAREHSAQLRPWHFLPFPAIHRILKVGGTFMESMNISLPEHLRDFVLKQVESGYGSVSEYIRELIRADENRKRQEALEAKLLEGLASGRGRELTDADWNDLKNVVLARHQTRKDMR